MQKYSSKNTSVNKNKLPLVYSKINWKKFTETSQERIKLLDYGAGKYTSHIKNYLARYGIDYYPYDPYNCSKEENEKAILIEPDIIICSNVLNVIKEDDIVQNIHECIQNLSLPYFITVWQGNKSRKGTVTIKGYQRNESPTSYLLNSNECVHKGVITDKKYLDYIL